MLHRLELRTTSALAVPQGPSLLFTPTVRETVLHPLAASGAAHKASHQGNVPPATSSAAGQQLVVDVLRVNSTGTMVGTCFCR
jgi:hypothetical protein